MALNFPNSPTDGQIYSDTQTGNRWVWDNANTCWKSTSTYAQTVTVSSTQPGTPTVGQLWWSQDVGRLFVYYNDGNSTQWVEANPADQTAGLVFNTANAAFGKANAALANTSGTYAGNLTITGEVVISGNTTHNKKAIINYTPSSTDNAAIFVAAANTQGGTGYADFLKVQNISTPAVTNGNKTFRLNSAGGIEVVNSAYNAILFGISDQGYMTTPTQPYARVSKNNGNIPYNTTIVFNYADDDTYGMYNATNGRFTAPVTGRYLFTHGMFTNSGSQAWLKWRVNGTAIATTYTAVTTSYNSVAGCVVLKMNANDWADLWVDSGTSAYTIYGNERTQCWAVFTLLG